MKKRKLGKTNLLVSEIGFGCRSIGGKKPHEANTIFSDISKENAEQIIDFAIESGINTFDTSDSYSTGRSEIRLGESISKRRSDVYIFTKGGTEFLNETKTKSRTNLSPEYLLNSLNNSLKRLQTDYVDLFQTHGIPKLEDVEGIITAFEKIKSENKARYCGISIGNAISRGLELIDYDFIDCIQISFSLINRDALDELIPKCFKKGIGIIVSRPLNEGFLSDFIIKKHFFDYDLRKTYSEDRLNNFQKKLDSLKFLQKLNLPLPKIAISYILSNDMISTCIPSSNSIEQLSSNIQATNIEIDPELIKKINSISN